MKFDLDMQVSQLEQELSVANAKERLRLHPRVQAIMNSLRGSGVEVPTRLRQMNARLADEAYDDLFDNIPV